jgi:predicted N-acyltransferase
MSVLAIKAAPRHPVTRRADGDYTYSIRDSIDERDPDEWGPFHQGEPDPMMDPRFLRAVERSMADGARFWNVVVRDGRGRPSAATVLSLFTIDGALLAEGPLGRAIPSMRRIMPRLLKFKVVFCGCPVSTGQNHLRFAPEADHLRILKLLDRLMLDLAREHGARWVAFKEFDDRGAARMDAAISLGYLRAESPQMNILPARFCSLDDLCAALRSHYRRKIMLSRKKLEKSGLRVEHLRGGEQIAHLYTDQVHRLYLSVFDRADTKLECLPPTFFRELARQFTDDALFTLLRRGEDILAFSSGLFHGESYQNLFVGYDPAYNADADLYFNVMLENVDFALRRGVRSIHLGQTANEFKSRVGSIADRRYFYVKARNPIGHLVLRWLRPYLFHAPPEALDRNVFK